jgi:hypothetical protein
VVVSTTIELLLVNGFQFIIGITKGQNRDGYDGKHEGY